MVAECFSAAWLGPSDSSFFESNAVDGEHPFLFTVYAMRLRASGFYAGLSKPVLDSVPGA